jgi:excisionase family DNA binding protein
MEVKKEWYSITELSEMGYGSRATIRQHIALGNFGAGKPGGGKWLIKKSEYDEWLKSRDKRGRRNRWQTKGHNRCRF